MKKLSLVVLASLFLAASGPVLRAQDQNAGGAPKVLVMQRESVKVGKDFAHMKNEAAYVRAATAAKSPDHYLATTTLSGPSEAWFLVGFDSYAEWEKAQAYDNSAKVTALTGPIMEKDADFVSESNAVIATYNDKWSYNIANTDLPHMRYFEVETIHLRPGHDKDWDSLISLFKTAAAKANLDEHDFFYEAHYGAPDGTIYIFIPRKSLAELDHGDAVGKQFNEALGEDGQKKWAQLIETTVSSASVTLMQFSPEMSYAPDDWVKADPSYWKPHPAAAAKTTAKAAKKPGDTSGGN